jgi:hypothetical protein
MVYRTSEASITHLGDEASFSVTGEHDCRPTAASKRISSEERLEGRIEMMILPKTEAMRVVMVGEARSFFSR